MSSDIKWERNNDWGYIAKVGPYTLYVFEQAIVSTSMHISWGVFFEHEDNIIARGEEKISHTMTLIRTGHGVIVAQTIEKCKRNAEKALFEKEADEEVEKWLTE